MTKLGTSAFARMSKSKTRRVAAIGNSRVIPAKAGIHLAAVKEPMDSRLRGNDGCEGSAAMTTVGRAVVHRKGVTNDTGFPLSRERRT
jgi:hypothetical protein